MDIEIFILCVDELIDGILASKVVSFCNPLANIYISVYGKIKNLISCRLVLA